MDRHPTLLDSVERYRQASRLYQEIQTWEDRIPPSIYRLIKRHCSGYYVGLWRYSRLPSTLEEFLSELAAPDGGVISKAYGFGPARIAELKQAFGIDAAAAVGG